MLLIHWIIDLINTPSVLEYRLLQISGTCWLNVILNSLILNNYLRNIIKIYVDYYWEKYEDKQPLKYHEFRDEEKVINIKYLLFSLFRNYFNGVKPNIDKDILIFLAALIKSYSEPEDEYNRLYQFIKHNRLNTEGSPYTKKHNRYYLCKANNLNLLRERYCTKPNVNIEQLEKLNDACGYKHDNKSICDNFDKDTDEEKGFIYGNGANEKYITEVLSIIFNLKINFDTKIQLNIKGYQYVLYLSTTEENLIRKGYTLCSCVIITHNRKHVICGTIIDSKYYVYDSNGIWVLEDWTKLNTYEYIQMKEYKKKIIKQGYYLTYPKEDIKSFWCGKISYKIYVKDNNRVKFPPRTIETLLT